MILNFLIPILLNLAAGLALSVIAYLIMPKPKSAKPEIQDLANPTADSGRPAGVLFGTKDVEGVNVLWYGEKNTKQRKIKV